MYHKFRIVGDQMYNEVNNEIYNLKEGVRIKEKLESLRNIGNIELEKKLHNKEQLLKVLEKEEKDVIKLENSGISSLFLSLLGKREDKLDKEREEYLTAKMKYEECLESIRELEAEIQYANIELKKYHTANEDYLKAIKQKRQIILKEDSIESKHLKERLEIINELKLDIKEIKEAIDAGEKANTSLQKMKDHLNTAKGWGMWDMMGGGLISNIAKHSAIEKANQIAHSAQSNLKSFQKELSDVNNFTEITVDISNFTAFADFFFDGFFVDWFVQSKINNSIDNVENTYNKISEIVRDLKRELEKLQSKLSNNERETKDILEKR